MRLIPSSEIPPLPLNAPADLVFDHLGQVLVEDVGADTSEDEAPLPAMRPAARARSVVAPIRSPRERCSSRRLEISGTASRDDSVQRSKAKAAAPGSRRERRWYNRNQLLPSADDLDIEGPDLLGGLAKPRGCFDTF